jgi:hypothetical protein
MPRERAKVYRNIELRQKWLGLEPIDAIALGAVLWLLMVVNRHALGWNLLAVVCAFFALRLLKRGKPEGYLLTLLRYYGRGRPFLSGTARDERGLQHPFVPTEAEGGLFANSKGEAAWRTQKERSSTGS